MSASGKSNVTDENLDKYSVELIWRRYTGHMETGKAWKDELKVVLFRQKYGVWWVCKLNTDMIVAKNWKYSTTSFKACTGVTIEGGIEGFLDAKVTPNTVGSGGPTIRL